MPVYRKETMQSPARISRLNVLSNTQAKIKEGTKNRIARSRKVGRNQIVFNRAMRWPLNKTNFGAIDFHFHSQLSRTIKEFFSTNPKRKMGVLDWGCYDGLSAKQLAQDSRLRVFGFSRDAHPNMISPGNVTFLNTEKPHLVRYLKKHKIKVDLIYSRMGLSYLSADELVSHLIELKPCVNVGGKIFTGVSWLSQYPEKIKELREAGYEPTYDSNVLLCLTRVK